MRIAINGLVIRSLYHGMATYLKNLILGLQNIDVKNKYIIILRSPIYESFKHLKKNNFQFYKLRICRPLRPLFEHSILPIILKNLNIDIVHGIGNSLPIYKVCPSVVTIHDLLWYVFPDFLSPVRRYYFRAITPFTIRNTDHIITPSNSTRRDIQRFFGTSPSKITVIPEAVPNKFKLIDDQFKIKTVRKKYNLFSKYILFIGETGPRKNLIRLVTAFYNLKQNSNLPHKLVIVGSRDISWRNDVLNTHIKNFNLSNEVLFTGPVETNDLLSIYSAADVFVIPSLYEGFGLPALEAMACGTPVIASNTSSLPEVVADCGIYIDPYDEGSISQALIEILCNKRLRTELKIKGQKRAKQFSWLHTAKQTLKVYKEIYY